MNRNTLIIKTLNNSFPLEYSVNGAKLLISLIQYLLIYKAMMKKIINIELMIHAQII